MRSLSAPLRPLLHPVPGLWLAALLIGCAPIVQSSIGLAPPVAEEQQAFNPSSANENVLALARLTIDSRALAAQQLAGREIAPADCNVTRISLLTRLRSLQPLMPDPARNELEAIESDWKALQKALFRGELSAPESFARHTQLLDRQLALQDTLRTAGL